MVYKMVFNKLTLLLIVNILFFNNICNASDLTDSLLVKLSNEIEKKDFYINQKTLRINNVKAKFKEIEPTNYNKQYYLYGLLTNEYRSFKFDSAFYYATKQLKTAYLSKQAAKIDESKIQLSFILVSSGMFIETLDSLKTIQVHELSDSLKKEYYAILARAYYDIGEYNQDNFYKPYYNNIAGKYVDSVRTLSEKNSYFDLYFSGLKSMKMVDLNKAKEDLSKLLDLNNMTSQQYAVATSTLSFIHMVTGDTTQAINLLAEASINDIKTATRETSALTSLAELLFKKGDIFNAYDLIQVSLKDADFYGAKHRKSRAATILQIIASGKVHTVEEQKSRLIIYAGGLSVVLLIIGTAIIIILRQYKLLKKAENKITQSNISLKGLNRKLREVNKIKEGYIGYYFSTHSEFIDRIEKFKSRLEIKLSKKKYDEIGILINNINVRREKENLYQNFDKVFLKLFPDFVEKFNALFNNEDKFKLDKEQFLNTELRIFALIRLGINDSNKLAKILGYSVNTIYAYKNRVKTKSIVSNDDFESKLMEIRSV